MYSSNILHLIQNPVNSTFLFTDCPGNNDLRSIVFTMKCISKDNRKERSHFIVNIRILRFPGFREIRQEVFCDPSLNDSAIPPGGSNPVTKPQSRFYFRTLVGPAMDLKGVTHHSTGSYDFIPPFFLPAVLSHQNIAAHSVHLPLFSYACTISSSNCCFKEASSVSAPRSSSSSFPSILLIWPLVLLTDS